MPANNLLPSVLGNVVAARERLSAVRQRMGLEPDAGQMRRLAPSPANGPADKPGAQIKTAKSGPPRLPERPTPKPTAKPAPAAKPKEDDFDEDSFEIPEELQNRMIGRIQQFIDANNNGIDDRMEGGSGRSPDDLANIALNPFRGFFAQNNRLPTLDEMKALSRST